MCGPTVAICSLKIIVCFCTALQKLFTNPLKYGFCKKSLRKNETLTIWTLLAHFFSRLALICSWSGKKVSQKCSTGQSFIFPKWLLTKSILYIIVKLSHLYGVGLAPSSLDWSHSDTVCVPSFTNWIRIFWLNDYH